MYLTPERFKTMGLGLDLSEVETVAIRSSINRSVAAIHSYCAVPMLPQAHNFKGGTITNEEHVFPTDSWDRARPFRVWPWHTPVRTVTALRLVLSAQGGGETYLDIDPGNMFISDQGFVEVTVLNLSQLVFASAVMPYVGLRDPVFRISYTYGYEFAVTDDACEPNDARTYQAQNQYWTDDPAEVKVNGVVVTTGFALNRTEGWVLFDANVSPDSEVTVSYTHKLASDIMQASAVLVARDLGEADLRAKGFEGLDSIQVKDVVLRRSRAAGRSGSAISSDDMPSGAARYLAGWVFQTAR